jgi:Putative peptidoglycan binding domain/Extensin-like protein C-terminus
MRDTRTAPNPIVHEVPAHAGRTSAAYIRWLQDALNTVIDAGLAVDGITGPRTNSALRLFQQRHGLNPDGVPGPVTERALMSAGAAPPPGPAPSPAPGQAGARACPEPTKLAVDRCRHPGTESCPAIPNLLCMREVDGIPFEYPTRVGRNAGGLNQVTQRIGSIQQRFIPTVRDALSAFIRNMSRFGMPIEVILTAGSLYCRCVSDSDTLSSHSFGDAIDVVGVRWPPFGGPASALRETIVHNHADPNERVLLRRINACLRLSFSTVIDYHRADHRDHFHCDMNRGRGRVLRGSTTMVFVQEALTVILGRHIPTNGQLDAATQQALRDFTGLGPQVITDPAALSRALDSLFTRVASGR